MYRFKNTRRDIVWGLVASDSLEKLDVSTIFFAMRTGHSLNTKLRYTRTRNIDVNIDAAGLFYNTL